MVVADKMQQLASEKGPFSTGTRRWKSIFQRAHYWTKYSKGSRTCTARVLLVRKSYSCMSIHTSIHMPFFGASKRQERKKFKVWEWNPILTCWSCAHISVSRSFDFSSPRGRGQRDLRLCATCCL